VALGDLGAHQVGRALLELERPPEPPSAPPGPARRAPPRRSSDFTVEGVGNLLVQLARCCQPVPGEPIVGYLTRGRGVTVHRADCAAFARL
ncbi:bifunctional (p)ppGpp synthetase/guanosine-3',5'-bis(diphosphate) 3'-pyrophosphohydrolase, partial [Acinetobacter baumannii]